jgi:hypothetical protein
MPKILSNEFRTPDDWSRFVKYLNETNRFVLTPSWKSFVNKVVKTAKSRVRKIKKDSLLIRARIGSTILEYKDGDEQPAPLSPRDMGAPPKNKAKSGRLNPHGISYLYLSSDIDTAIAEVRPWMGVDVSIGYFKAKRELKVVDTTLDKSDGLARYEFVKKAGELVNIKLRNHKSYNRSEKEALVWSDISTAFSIPVTKYDSNTKYLSTQYIAEVLKTSRLDGIVYKSSLNTKGKNIVLFDDSLAECTTCRMFEILSVKYEHNESGNPIWLSPTGSVISQRISVLGRADKTE